MGMNMMKIMWIIYVNAALLNVSDTSLTKIIGQS